MKLVLATVITLTAALSVVHPADAPAPNTPAGEKAKVVPCLRLDRVEPPQREGKAQQLAFIGDGGGPIHRAGPEHFLLTQSSDGRRVALAVAYDRAELEPEPRGELRVQLRRPVRVLYRYGYQFRSIALHLSSGEYDAKDAAEAEGRLTLHGRADLEPRVKYRLTWACWPVGAQRASEVSCEFEVGR
jgi:hypothetical protein